MKYAPCLKFFIESNSRDVSISYNSLVSFLFLGEHDIEVFYKNTLARTQNLHSHHLSSASHILEACIKDLNHVERASPRLAPTAHFQSLYIKCINLLYKIRAERTWSVPTPITSENSGFFTSAVKELLSMSYKLENMFLGLSSQESASVKLVRISFNSRPRI